MAVAAATHSDALGGRFPTSKHPQPPIRNKRRIPSSPALPNPQRRPSRIMDFDELVEKKYIDLSDKELRDGDLDVLTEAVGKSGVLKELKLEFNRLTLADGKMAEAIARNPTLRLLNLGCNQVADEGAKSLADAIKANETLQEIYLHDNEIGDEGAKSFVDALAVNKSLRALSLGRNKIGDEGARSLAASFETNWTLRKVHLQNNNITDKGAQKLADTLKKNYSINHLDLQCNPISNRVKSKINAILDHKSRTHVQKIVVSKDEENAALKRSLVAKDQELEAKEEEIARRDEHISRKDKEITSLKAAHSALLETIHSLKESFKARLEQLKVFVDTVDLTVGDPGPPKKRPRTESAAKSNLAVLHEQNQKMVRIKQEKNAAETALEGAREEKAAAEADLDEARDNLGDANVLVQQQALATDVWQRRFDELASMVDGQVDGAVIAEIRYRSLASGS